LGTLFVLAAFYMTDDSVRLWELEFYRTLDATLGVAPTWDWFILLVASAWFISLCGAGLLVLLLEEAWQTRRDHFGRAYAFILGSIAFMFVTGMMVELATEEIRRKSPWFFIHGNRHKLEQFVDIGLIHFSRRTDLMDEVTYGWTFLTLALGLRFRRFGIYSLLGVVLFSGSNMILGRHWPISVIGSMALGSVGAGVWLLGWGRPLGWLERRVEELFVRLLWRRLLPLEAMPQKALLDQPAMSREARRRGRRKQRHWDAVVRQVVIPVVAPGVIDYRILREPPVVEGHESAPSSYVRFVQLADGTMYVVKFVRRRASPFHVPHRIVMYSRAARMNAVLGRLGFPVPRQYWVAESINYGGLVRTFVSVEEYLCGRPLSRENAEELRKGLCLLARMHRETSDSWGCIDRDPSQSFAAYIYRYAQQQAAFLLRRVMIRHNVHLSDAEVSSVWRRLEAHLLARQRQGGPFRLIHGDVTQKNIMLDANGGCHLIDFTDTAYDLAGGEAIKGVIHLFRRLPAHRTQAWASYFEAREPGAWDEFLAEAPAAFAFFAIRELAQGRIPLAPMENLELRSAAVLAWLQRVVDVPAAAWGPSPAGTRWVLLDALLVGIAATPSQQGPQPQGSAERIPSPAAT